jgi:hypothetical protein
MPKQEGLTLSKTALADAETLLIAEGLLDKPYIHTLTDDNRDGVIRVLDPGRHFSGVIREQRRKYRVQLQYSALHGWEGTCSCSDADVCLHALALLNILMNAASIAGSPLQPSPSAAHPTAPSAPNEAPGALAGQVATRLGRTLLPAEIRILTGLKDLHDHQLHGYPLTIAHLSSISVYLSSQSLQPWTPLHSLSLPPSEDPAIWWGNLVVALIPHELRAPEVLISLADLPAAKLRMQQWQRAQDIQKWRAKIKDFTLFLPGAGTEDSLPVSDVRLSIHAGGNICLEGQLPGTDVYRPLTSKAMKRLIEEGAPASWPPEALLLWSLLTKPYLHYAYSTSPILPLSDAHVQMGLANALGHPSLVTRLVTEDGKVMARPEGRLRWEVRPAGTEADNYTLRLLPPGGEPLPPLIATLPAHPLAYYLTATAIYLGPHQPTNLFDPAMRHTIPAPALETAEGAQWLRAIDAPFPPRLAERVRHETIPTTIRCALRRPTPTTELCLFMLSAVSSNGMWQATLIGRDANWRITEKLRPPATPEPGAPPEPILLYDQSSLPAALAFVNELEARWSGEFESLSARVTKTFPERFADWVRRPPPNVQLILDGDLASLAEAAVAGQFRLEVEEHSPDWFDLRVAVSVQDTTLTPEEIRLLLAAHGHFVRLPQKGWRRLAFTLSPEEEDAMARLGLNPRDFDAEPQRLHALQLADGSARRMLPQEQATRVERRAEEIRLRSAPDVPAGITAQLRPYQLEGFHFLSYLSANRFGGILADDMGLGKTLQALAWLLWLRAGAGKKPPPALIVCPKSVTDNWLAEATRFAPGLRVRVWRGGEAISGLTKPDSADLHVINYHQLRQAEECAVRSEWLAVVLDEGQQIKNPSSQVAQAARRLRARHRLVLTGTPIENQLLDLWSLFAFAMPGVLGNRAQFGRTFDAKGDPNARRRLSARVRPFLLRRTKAQVAADLPPRVEEDLFCEMEGAQLALYQAERKRARQILLRIETDQQLADQRFHILVSLLRLRQICCHPALVHPEAAPGESAKLDALLELLEPLMEEGHKVLVFSQFVEALALIRRALEARGWKHFLLTGETEDRGDLVQAFKASPDPAVFLISLRAGGSGLNLAEASYVVLFDPWWNPAVENQAIDRTHRIGQTRTVNAYRLLVKGTVEEKIRKLQEQKKGLAEDVLGEERFAQTLTLNDLQFLFDS